ncbi:MAG: glycosyl transferase family 2 [Cyclobacteriaceae bacterium]|nr:MAG: glycosyl transferase family 2 [Cyclobacteriaceae bacterium]
MAFTPDNKIPPAGTTNEKVSVIVCAHNQLHNLQILLPKLLKQDYPVYEIIIVNDRSTDGTKPWLEKQSYPRSKIRTLDITTVTKGQNPKKHALVRGVEAANYQLLLLTDADCYPKSNNWIRLMVQQYKPGINIVLGYSGYTPRPGLLNKLIRYETLVTAIQYLSRALAKKPYMGVGRNLSYKKAFFQHTGGLKGLMHLTGGDDDLFVNRNANGENTAVCLEKDSVVMSYPKLSWDAYFKQKIRHLSVGKYYKKADLLILGIFSVTHIIFWSSLVSLLVTQTMVGWVVAGFIIRQLSLSWVVEQSSRKLGEHIGICYVPLLDFLYSLFYLLTGLSALVTKKVDWH